MLQCPVLTIADLALGILHQLVKHMDHANAMHAAVMLQDLSLLCLSWNLCSDACFPGQNACLWAHVHL